MTMFFRIFIFAFLLVSTSMVQAEVVLEITGKISRFNNQSHSTYSLSDADFLALPQTTIRTATNWTPLATFTGVKLTDLIKLVGAYGAVLEFRTLDNYMVRVPIEEFSKYGVILARTMNGELLTLSNFGPYFVIYPRDAFRDELKTVIAESKFAWQVNKIIVR